MPKRHQTNPGAESGLLVRVLADERLSVWLMCRLDPTGAGQALLELDQDPTCLPQQGSPGRRQLHPAAIAFEEPDADLLLQLGDLTAQGGLGNVQALRCPAEVELLGDGDEVPELPKLDVHVPTFATWLLG
jgi:hypothetical protein